jgi:hypothetical protein
MEAASRSIWAARGVAAGPSGGCADLVHHDGNEIGRAGFQQVSGAQKVLAPFVRTERGPNWESLRGGFRGGDRVIGAGGGRVRGYFTRKSGFAGQMLPHSLRRHHDHR